MAAFITKVSTRELVYCMAGEDQDQVYT